MARPKHPSDETLTQSFAPLSTTSGTWLIFHAPTMTWNTFLVRLAITSNEQRAGNKPLLVLSYAAVRIVATIATQKYHFSGSDLVPRDLMQWRTLRKQVDYRHEARREQYRFRKDPEHYLLTLGGAAIPENNAVLEKIGKIHTLILS